MTTLKIKERTQAAYDDYAAAYPYFADDFLETMDEVWEFAEDMQHYDKIAEAVHYLSTAYRGRFLSCCHFLKEEEIGEVGGDENQMKKRLECSYLIYPDWRNTLHFVKWPF